MAKKTTSHLGFSLTVALLTVGLAALVTVLTTRESQELRIPAVDSGNPVISVSTNPPQPVVNQTLTLEFHINTKAKSISGIQMTNLRLTSSDVTLTSLPSSLTNTLSELNPLVNTITSSTQTLAQVSYLAGLSNLSSPLNTQGSTATFATLSFTPTSTGTITVDFDPLNTIVTEYGAGGQNILDTPPDQSLTIAPGPNPSPSPSSSACPVPSSPQNVKARPGPDNGTIRVSWQAPENTDHYSITFGPKSGQYQWGAADIGNTREFIIRQLRPGSRYYIVISAVNRCGGSAYSQEVSAVAAGTPNPTPTTSPTPEPTPEIVLVTPEPSVAPVVNPSPSPSPPPSPSPSPTVSTTETPAKKGPRPILIIGGIAILVGAFVTWLFSRSRSATINRIKPDEQTLPSPPPQENPPTPETPEFGDSEPPPTPF